MKDGDTGFDAFVYHDEPEEAGTEQEWLGLFDTRSQALSAVRSGLWRGPHWNGGGSIHRGVVTEDHLGMLRIEGDYEATCQVSYDGMPDADEWPLLAPPKVGVPR